MSKEIVVQGERYADVDTLLIAVDELQQQLDNMPSDSPEHTHLARHIERLRNAAEEVSGESGGRTLPSELPPSDTSDAVTDVDEEPEATTSMREAYETGSALLCPTCGQEVDLPESPPKAPDTEPCPSCNGWGTGITGSRVDGHIWRECKQCQGQGYVETDRNYVANPVRKAEPVAQAPGARWNPISATWDPPEGQQPPWEGAQWDSFYGKWS